MSERVMTEKLEQRHCTPCRGGVPPLDEAAAKRYLVDLPDWQLADDAKRISRDFRFKNFAQALAFVNEVGAIAEAKAIIRTSASAGATPRSPCRPTRSTAYTRTTSFSPPRSMPWHNADDAGRLKHAALPACSPGVFRLCLRSLSECSSAW
jgi:hypothetical protein